jgi:hypothetical protein
VAIGDLSGDGWPDLAVTNEGSNSVSIMLNDGGGNGWFGDKIDYAVPPDPRSVAIGDLNDDGSLDIAVANSGSTFVAVFLNDGIGRLGPRTDFPVSIVPTAIAIGDLSGDGRPDLAVASESYRIVSILRGNGAGSFGPKTDILAGGQVQALAIGDLDGDGRADLAASNDSGNGLISVILESQLTRTSISSSPTHAVAGVPLTLRATVSVPALTYGTPSGSVVFFDGTASLGSSWVDSWNDGVATITLPAPAVGMRNYSAVYMGDGRYSGSISNMQNKRVAASAAPLIMSVRDVPNDQGGRLKVSWQSSGLDVDPDYGIAAYWVWRSVPPNVAAEFIAKGATVITSDDIDAADTARGTCLLLDAAGVNTTYWEYLGSSPGTGDPGYSFVVPTTSDSLPGSNPRTLVRIQARSAMGSLFWNSLPDSGYSVDNIAPAAPFGLRRDSSGLITWQASIDADFQYFSVYGSAVAHLDGSEALLARTATMSASIGGVTFAHILVTATDCHGNQSAAAVLDGPTAAPNGTPMALRLLPCQPNPFNPRTTIKYDLPAAGPVRLSVFDVAGRLVRTLVDDSVPQGSHEAVWDGRDASGREVGSGSYLARLEFGGKVEAVRMGLVR